MFLCDLEANGKKSQRVSRQTGVRNMTEKEQNARIKQDISFGLC
jgi:hypothetical protein